MAKNKKQRICKNCNYFDCDHILMDYEHCPESEGENDYCEYFIPKDQ